MALVDVTSTSDVLTGEHCIMVTSSMPTIRYIEQHVVSVDTKEMVNICGASLLP